MTVVVEERVAQLGDWRGVAAVALFVAISQRQ